jgi:hypothetical protein
VGQPITRPIIYTDKHDKKQKKKSVRPVVFEPTVTVIGKEFKKIVQISLLHI